MIEFSAVASRREEVREVPVDNEGRVKRLRILSDITVDDVMDNLIKAEAMKVKLGSFETPTIGRPITDYLLGQRRAT